MPERTKNIAAGTDAAAVPSAVAFGKAAWTRVSRIHGYLPALAALVAAMAIHSICLLVFGNNSAAIFFVYLTAILIAGWCGYGPGLLVLLR